jgi:hypothetical protein
MNRVEFRLDRFTRGVLAAITVLLTIIAIELWVGRPDVVSAANAQIPDSGRQRVEMTAELRRTNGLLGGILDHLRTKPVKVLIVAPDKSGGQKR